MKLIYQFASCNHCGKRWPGLRYDCPYCNWPREHTDVTPAPTSGMADQSVAAKPVSQAAAGAEQSVFNDPITGLPIPKVPQAPPLDPEAALQQISLGQVAAAQLKQAVMAPATLRLEADSSPVTVATSEPHHVQALMSETVIAEAVAILDSVKAPKKRGRPRKNA